MAIDAGAPLDLHLVGPLRLIRRDGADLTPRLIKAQAMLALLATANNFRRSRVWIQDKLWSDRQSEQGSASLRQALATLRHALRPDSGAILAEAGWICLASRQVVVHLDPEPGDWSPTGELPEFCEGLHVPDAEFEDWIRDQRLAFERRWANVMPPEPQPQQQQQQQRQQSQPQHQPPQPAPTKPQRLRWEAIPAPNAGASVLIAVPDVAEPGLSRLVSLVAFQIAGQIACSGGIEVRLEALQRPAAPIDDVLGLQLRASRFGQWEILQAELLDMERGTLLWVTSRHVPLDAHGAADPDDLASFVAEVTAAAIFELGRGGSGSSGASIRAAYRALRDILSCEPGALSASEAALAATDDLPNGAVRRAWRAHIRLISVIERLTQNAESAAHEAVEFATRALQEDPLNAIVNALASDVALLVERRPLKAMELAKTAVALDGASPFTHSSLSQALAWSGNTEEAHTEALRALRLARGQPNLAWWHIRCAATAVRAGRFDEALRFARTANEITPNFRPPLRFLAALLFERHDEEAARAVLQKLKAIEPDFTLDLMGSDLYPVVTLRESGMLGVANSKLL